jgi:uncharacterized membrane protein YeaQ/YmgE (transglycosylase-associated protein family)
MDNFKLNPAIISILVVIAFAGVLALLLLKPVSLSAEVGTIINVLTGTLAAKFGDVVSYHIGSSAVVSGKDDILHKLAQA